ncbi:MAG TPA: glutamate racemase, partial [Pyrinomonadaceae bacterium]|nr:glutamate racemase [Pyrinomonadaceae bacterium]
SKFLEAHGIKLLVVACNTASALALPAIRNAIKVPVIGVIEPGSRAAVEIAQGANIGVIATEATVQSHAYAKAIAAMGATARVIERACPLFVALAEEGWADTDVVRIVARDYLSEFTGKTLGALVLGCTHYPILRDVISETVGSEIDLIDSGEATARDVDSLLNSSDLTHEDALGLYQERQLCDDLDHFYVTDAAERFAKVAERFLGSAPSILEAVEIWGHDELRTH